MLHNDPTRPTMTRKDFIAKLGIGAAFALTVPCLHSCSKDDDGMEPMPPTGINLTIDLTASGSAALQNPGGFIVLDRVVIARTLDGEYAAASLVCSHENNLAVVYDDSSGEWFCGVHGARFDEDSGAPLNSVTDRNLTLYTVALSSDGNTLTVTS